MNAETLMHKPAWQAETLGQPKPNSVHGVSVALPRWADVVGYEEKDPAVMSRMASGYPRFVIHPLVQQIARELGGSHPCLPFPSRRVAERCLRFLAANHPGVPATLVSKNGLFAVLTENAAAATLKSFWQHTGLIVCSRQAEAFLTRRPEDPESAALRLSLRRQLAHWYDCAEDDIFLTPTGMAAQFAALQAVQQRQPGRRTAQLGFPYVDTLKIQEKLGHGGILLHNLSRIAVDLDALLEREPLAACFGEIPGNPLLGSADLREVTPILRQHGVPFVADDVVATPINVDLSAHADLVATSLTKYVVGTGDAMGGALICNPRSPYYAELKALVKAQHEELLWGGEARVVDQQARGFPERMRQHNRNGLHIAEQLRQHPAVEKVWYPKWEFNDVYEAVRRPDGGWGSLVTFLPRDAVRTSPRIFDNLPVCKGPSLGTIFTLACPFTLLAHYTELDWAESCGVSRHLIRLSVGLEPPEELWPKLAAALATV